MDFSSLTRRELQSLCKKNKLPANLTNVAMADSLTALEHVEGIEELLNQSPEKTMNGSLSIARTAGRTSTRRKPEPESSQPLTQSRCGTRKAASEDVVDQGRTVVAPVPKTPAAAPSTRRRAPAASALQKTETQKEGKTSVQHGYSTRRSVRLLEKNMSKLSLDYENSMQFKMDELSTEINNGSEMSYVSQSVDKGSCMQTGSEACSERVDVSEVSLEPKSEVIESKAASDVVVVSEAMDESHEEGSDESHKAENNSATKVLDDVSAEVMDHITAAAAQSSLLEEVNESLSEEKSTDSIISLAPSSTHGQAVKESDGKAADDQDCENEEVKGVVNVEEVAKAKALVVSFSDEHVLSSKDYAAVGDFTEKFDFESDSTTEEDEAMTDIPFECQDKKSDDMQAGEGGFESDSITEEDDSAADNISEEESDEGDSEVDTITEEDSDADDSSEEEPSEDMMPNSVKQMSPMAKMQEVNNSEALVDVKVMAAAEEICMMTDDGAPSLDETPPLAAADQLAVQFPRPTLPKPEKSSAKKQSAVKSYIFDDNEENGDSSDKNSDIGGAEMKKDEEDTANKDMVLKALEGMSLRKLKKLAKETKIGGKKMITAEDKNGNKMTEEKPRTALQEVPENQMAAVNNKPVNGN